MPGKRPHYYLPSTEQVTKLIADTREVTARSVALLKLHPKPDSFAGRKTQEPFPADDPMGREDIQKLIHGEQLQPPLQPPKNDQ